MKVHFGDNKRLYRRRYTRWFDDSGKCGPKLADYSLNNYRRWEDKIEEWQAPVLTCRSAAVKKKFLRLHLETFILSSLSGFKSSGASISLTIF